MKSDKNQLQIATIGKVVGLWGDMKLHKQTDFDEQFKKGSKFVLTNGKTIEIENYNSTKSQVKFVGYNIREDAQKLTNQKLFTSVDATREVCSLEEGEFFWFDVVGSSVFDDGKLLGMVDEIERISAVDYLSLKQMRSLLKKSYQVSFISLISKSMFYHLIKIKKRYKPKVDLTF